MNAQPSTPTQSANIGPSRIRKRVITAVGVTALFLAVLAGIFAVSSNQNAQQAQNNLLQADQQRNAAQNAQATAQAASTRATADSTLSEAQRLAAEANSLMVRNGDTNVIALLTVRSLNMRYTLSGDTILTSCKPNRKSAASRGTPMKCAT